MAFKANTNSKFPILLPRRQATILSLAVQANFTNPPRRPSMSFESQHFFQNREGFPRFARGAEKKFIFMLGKICLENGPAVEHAPPICRLIDTSRVGEVLFPLFSCCKTQTRWRGRYPQLAAGWRSVVATENSTTTALTNYCRLCAKTRTRQQQYSCLSYNDRDNCGNNPSQVLVLCFSVRKAHHNPQQIPKKEVCFSAKCCFSATQLCTKHWRLLKHEFCKAVPTVAHPIRELMRTVLAYSVAHCSTPVSSKPKAA